LLPIRLSDPAVRRGLDVQGDPLRPQPVRQALGGPDEVLSIGAGPETHQDPLGSGPGLAHGVVLAVALHLDVHAVGRATQRQLPQGDQIAWAEEVPEGLLGELGEVDLPLFHALDELVRREIHEFHFVGLLEDRVGNALCHGDAGDLRHHAVEALDVLDV